MQAFITKILPPTNHLGKRVRVTCKRASRIYWLGRDIADIGEIHSHKRAVELLCDQFVKEDHTNHPWMATKVTGQLPNGNMVHVLFL